MGQRQACARPGAHLFTAFQRVSVHIVGPHDKECSQYSAVYIRVPVCYHLVGISADGGVALEGSHRAVDVEDPIW